MDGDRNLAEKLLFEIKISARIVKYDMLFLYRQGFFAAYAIIVTAYIGFFSILPNSVFRSAAVIFSVYSDTAIIGFFFSAGMVFLEKDQKLLSAWNVLPVSGYHYLAGKILSFSLISILISLVLYIPYLGIRMIPQFSLGVLISVLIYIPMGLLIAMKMNKLLNFLLISALILMPALFPLLDYFNIVHTGFGKLLPGYGILMLLGSALPQGYSFFNPVHLISPCICAGLFIAARGRLKGVQT